jgi:GH25 family lysozyme M1 (1,4-beta-N-acetylmuramidase)
MKLTVALLLAAVAVSDVACAAVKRASPQGIDVSDFQPSVNWATVKANGISFAYIKATEGTSKL